MLRASRHRRGKLTEPANGLKHTTEHGARKCQNTRQTNDFTTTTTGHPPSTYQPQAHTPWPSATGIYQDMAANHRRQPSNTTTPSNTKLSHACVRTHARTFSSDVWLEAPAATAAAAAAAASFEEAEDRDLSLVTRARSSNRSLGKKRKYEGRKHNNRTDSSSVEEMVLLCFL